MNLKFLRILSLLFLLSSCQSTKTIEFDYVILEPKKGNKIIENFKDFWTPSYSEILEAETYLKKQVKKEARKNQHWTNLNLESLIEYKRQYVCLLDQKGKKYIWINAFLYPIMHPETGQHTWKKDLEIADDGGDFYFQCLIDMTNLKIIYFNVNGEA